MFALIYRLLRYVAGFSETMNFLIVGKHCVDLAGNGQLDLHNAFKRGKGNAGKTSHPFN